MWFGTATLIELCFCFCTAVVTCPTPTGIENGFIEFAVRRMYHYNESVGFGCQPSYVLHGPKHSRCEKTGNWSTKPTCKGTDTPAVGNHPAGWIPLWLLASYYSFVQKKTEIVISRPRESKTAPCIECCRTWCTWMNSSNQPHDFILSEYLLSCSYLT